jgi:hypothetical protein
VHGDHAGRTAAAERATFDQSGEPRLNLPGSVPDALPYSFSERGSCTIR